MHDDPYYDVDKLRSKAYAGMVAISYLRSITDKVDYVADNFGIDFVRRYLADIIDHYDSGDYDL
jgi:hypothetical protein